MSGIYSDLSFPPAPIGRPYTFINMVATIDGKTVTGDRNEAVQDLGSDTDHKLMRILEMASDAILIGAGNLRATPKLWYPAEKIRIVATRSGDLNYGSRFFTDAPANVIVVAPPEVNVPQEYTRIPNSWPTAFRLLKDEHEIANLLVEGGSELNAELLRANLVDELFLTLSPKVKLGKDVPTYAGGEPLPREAVQNYALVEHHAVDDELFLRYRRKP